MAQAGSSLTITAIIVKKLDAALAEFPLFNAVMDEAANEIVYREYINVGVAMDTERLAPAKNVVQALQHLLALDAKEGDGVIVQPPVYFPFYSIIRQLRLRRIDNPLVLQDGRYEMDFEDLEEKIKKEKAKYLNCCSPHNPCGRVWTMLGIAAHEASHTSGACFVGQLVLRRLDHLS